MTTETAVPAATVPPVDALAVELCADGLIAFAKLTAPEKVAAAELLAARGLTPTQSATRLHGTAKAVAAALARGRTGGGGD